MRAWQIEGDWGREHLACVERPDPTPGKGEVALRVRAVSLNYRDLMVVAGTYNPRMTRPLVPCSDACAEVIAVGEDVRRVAVGDRVMPAFTQGWRAGPIDAADLGTTLGGPRDGTLREQMVVPADAVVPVPDHLSDAEAATLPCAAVTAWHTLTAACGVTAGDTVLTLGTGGVSTFVVQLGTLMGARVVVTSSSDDKLARMAELGAVHGVNYARDDNWGKTVRAFTGGRGVDAVVELGGAGTLSQSLRAVRPGGHIGLIGVLAGARTEIDLPRIFMFGVHLHGVLVGSRADLEGLTRALVAHPDVRPVIDRTFGFDEAPAAMAYLEQGAHIGKVVIQVVS